jgi:hypothetical protein
MIPERRHARRVVDAVTTFRNLALEPMLGPQCDAMQDRGKGIPTGPSRAKALDVG